VASSLQHSEDYVLSTKRKDFPDYTKDYPLLDENSVLGR
jgi:hypothetical protein